MADPFSLFDFFGEIWYKTRSSFNWNKVSLPASLLSPDDALERLKHVFNRLVVIKPNEQTPFYPLFMLLFRAHEAAVLMWQDSDVGCHVPWDEETSLPSHPTLCADAVWYGKRMRKEVGILLQSFGEWTVLGKESIRCACGGSDLRTAEVEFLLRHDLSVKNSALILAETVAARSKDKKFLTRHFDDFVTQVDEEVIVVAARSGSMRISGNNVVLAALDDNGALLCNREKIYRAILEAAKGLSASLAS